MQLSDFKCPVYAHVVGWFGSGNTGHIDVGYSSSNPATIHAQLLAMKAKGFTGVNPLWSGIDGGPDKRFSTNTVTNWMRECESTSTPFFITIDHPEAFSLDSMRLLSVFFSSPMYAKFKGKPILLAFDALTADQLAAAPSCAIVYRNAGGISQPGSSGAFEWPSPPQTQAYTDYFHKATAAATDKLIISHVCPGFRGASWNDPKMVIPWRAGQEWADSLARVPANPMMVLVATWNDHDEGTGVEGTYLQ